VGRGKGGERISRCIRKELKVRTVSYPEEGNTHNCKKWASVGWGGSEGKRSRKNDQKVGEEKEESNKTGGLCPNRSLAA